MHADSSFCIYFKEENRKWQGLSGIKRMKKRIISCLIVLFFLIIIYLIGCMQQGYVPAMGSVQEGKKKIALTFDDGPHPHYTQQLLDGLRERNIKATFFVTGEHASLHPDVIAQMKEDGHVIGNHTYSHMQLNRSNREKFKEELMKTNEVIESITGEEVVYVRPPYGSWDKRLEDELNMFPVLWTLDPLDWCSDNVGTIVRKVLSKAKENDIVLMHDYYPSSVTAAFQIVDELQKQGYEFVTVEEILFD